MQPKNLGWKFAFVGLLVALALYAIWAYELRQGLDLKGGHILTFEVELHGDEGREVVREVIKVLKRRIDPGGMSDMDWRPVGNNRFEVRMPMGTDEARRAKETYIRALERVEEGNIQRSQVRQIVALKGPQREAAIGRIARSDRDRAEALKEMGEAHDAMAKAQAALEELSRRGNATPEALKVAQDAYDDAAADYDGIVKKAFDANVSVEALRSVLGLYMSPAERKAMPLKRRDARDESYGDGLDGLRKRHVERRGEIDEVVSAYEKWTDTRKGLDDPADLKRLIARAGVLEFRIAATLPGGRRGTELTRAQYQDFLEQLAVKGPLAGRSRNDPLLWFPMRGVGKRMSPDLVVGKYAGRKYVLLYNQGDFVMLQRGGAWSLKARRTEDNLNRPAVGFKLNVTGAKMMGLMTSANKGRFMAILLDDEVYSAPVIKATIYDSGVVEGEFTYKEVGELVQTLNAGALKARVNPIPVSEKTIEPSMGADNRKAGIRAAIWGAILVAVFMLIYYWAAGAIANVALLLNLIFLLGAMSFIEAVFTLPGIAGVILTIGMAVDANVLIFERLREEQAKTQSIRMALRNAYSNAASAILDGNATTLITCLILGWVGTEEVRGFAITLGLGVMFSLFTSLLVTRWIFQLLVEGLAKLERATASAGGSGRSGAQASAAVSALRGAFLHLMQLISRLLMRSTEGHKSRFRMLAFIGTPRVDWMAKRRVFWVGSILLVAVGIAALSRQGKDILGLEFSSGTQAVFNFKPGRMIERADGGEVLPERAVVQSTVRAAAAQLAGRGEFKDRSEDLTRIAQTAKVETLINRRKANETLERFDANADEVIDRAEWAGGKGAAGFFDRLDADGDGKVTRPELAAHLPERSYQVSTTVADVGLLRKVVRASFGRELEMSGGVKFQLQKSGQVPGLRISLDAAGDGRTYISMEALAERVAPRVRDTFIDMAGGVLLVIRDLQPALEESELVERIRTMRTQLDFEQYGFNKTAVVGLEAKPGGEAYKSFAVLVLNPNVNYHTHRAEWRNFAGNELRLLTAAMGREKSMESVVAFDAAVAGETAWRAGFAFVLSWMMIILYLWLRFGSARWGLAAVICLVHDVVIAIGMVAVSALLATSGVGRWFLIDLPFKIDMTVVAAFLTIIGYSVNDTIVVFDRIRENRGKLATVDEVTINRSVNQTISRTLLTTFTTLLAVVTMYVGGGPGIRPFTYALLVGIIIGTYSSMAVASPMLLGFKQALIGRLVGPLPAKKPKVGPAE